MSILVVEDDSINRLVTTQFLVRAGYEVKSCVSGAEALEAVATDEYTMILLDMGLPDMDGIEVCRRIRAMDASATAASVPVIAVTAHAAPADHNAFLAAGVDAVVTKPIDREKLIAAVAERIGGGN